MKVMMTAFASSKPAASSSSSTNTATTGASTSVVSTNSSLRNQSGSSLAIGTATMNTPNNVITSSSVTSNSAAGSGNSSSSIVSLSIRSEIHRFESVHPSIYSIYELLDQVGDLSLAQAIREHVVNIEDCFVNSQEWTLSRSVSELHVGLLGSQMSPKSTLVHRYLTNQYVQDNSPEGGRFKKEIIINNAPYLLLLRDEGGPPELQFSHWTDAIILVASSTQTTNTCFSYITRFANYRSLNEVPIVLVSVDENLPGQSSPSSQDFIKEFKKIPHSGYYHCNVRTGMNVEKIFSEVCNMIVNKKTLMPPPATPNLLAHPTTHLQRSNSSLSDKNITPISTPTTSRKFRRRSNIFKSATQDLGSGRTIPIKQGYLLKKSNNSNSKITNKKWKKKYVTISEGKMEYFDHINQYMENPGSGKQIELKHVTVKLTRNNPHSVKTITDSLSTLSLKKNSFNVPAVPPEEAHGFQLVSISKQWDFEAQAGKEGKADRDEWVELIEEQIVKSLQANISDRVSSRRKEEGVSEEEVGTVKRANSTCADCNAVLCKGGYWASLNLCVVVCIACSGVHRNLGTHLSKIRSMELDEMSNLLIAPLKSIESNVQANLIYEANVPANAKPNGASNCSAEERSSYIRRKYENLEFLPREPTVVTHDMVFKSIIEKNFWNFLLYVNLLRREGASNAFWSDGNLLNLAISNEFVPAAQVILWISNDGQQQEQNQPPSKQEQNQPSSSSVLTYHQSMSTGLRQPTPNNHVLLKNNSIPTPLLNTTPSAAKLIYKTQSQTNNAQYYSSSVGVSSSTPVASTESSSSLPCGIISSSNKLNSVSGGGVGTVTGGIASSRVLNNNNNASNTSSNGSTNKKLVI